MEVQFCCHIKLLLIPCLVDDGVLSDWEREAIVQGHGRLQHLIQMYQQHFCGRNPSTSSW